MSRPTIKDACILRRTAERMTEGIVKWLNESDCNKEEITDQLEETFIACANDLDGYRLARYLDRDMSWTPDENLVDILTHVECIANGILHEEVINWVVNNSISLKYKVGDTVILDKTAKAKIRSSFFIEVGDKPIKVVGLYPMSADYVLGYDGQSRMNSRPIIHAEFVQPPPLFPIESIPDATGNSLAI